MDINSENKKPKGGFPIKNTAAGFVIGVGSILPGVSGGVMAVSFGLYHAIIDAIATFFKSPKKNLIFLFPIVIGIILGMFTGSVTLDWVMNEHYTEVMYLFLGLVAGGLPSFIQESNKDGFKTRYILFALGGALLALCLLFFERSAAESVEIERLAPWQALAAGAILATGSVIPGISTSFILMYLGWYKPAMAAVANLEILTLLFMGIGAALCALALIKGVRWLFGRFHGYAYWAVLGFLAVSAVLIFPGFEFSLKHFFGILFMVLGFICAYAFSKLFSADKK